MNSTPRGLFSEFVHFAGVFAAGFLLALIFTL